MGWVETKLEHLGAAISLEAEQTRLAMSAGLAETQRGLRVDGAGYRALPVAGGLVYAGGRRLVGWSARETSGTSPVAVDLYDCRGAGDTGPGSLVATFTLAAGGSTTHTVMPAGVSFGEGLYAVVTGGGVLSGSVWIGVVD